MNRLKRIRLHSSVLSNRGRTAVYACLFLFVLAYFCTVPFASSLKQRYEALQTETWLDRNGISLSFAVNEKGHFSVQSEEVPSRFNELLLSKEDKFFYYHLGINPWSTLRGMVSLARTGKANGSSTITQQLVKVLLGGENDRTFKNKLVELGYAFALELHASKKDILSMYEAVAYFGKNRQGVTEASRYFFNKKPTELNEAEMVSLITALSSPSARFPGSTKAETLLPSVAQSAGSDLYYATSSTPEIFSPERIPVTSFELKTLGLSCEACNLSIDAGLSEKIRETLRRHIESASTANVNNGAVVVIKLPENELLAVVGSPNPRSLEEGGQLNMAIEPRSIGSTAKPFIYLNAFVKGARPYTLVDDEEYRYTTEAGFAFYPKNFDGKFRGTVTLHNALSNSLNVPAVKTLEYVGLPEFYRFLQESLGFTPKQPLERYELGIALGALEVDLLTLSHFFTIFPNKGVLKPLTIEKAKPGLFKTPMEKPQAGEKRVADASFVQLVNRILSDREMAVEQFGLRSNLTLPYKNYALKTGTSGNYHDSWTVGYTPDFLVGVWLGNSDNSAMRELTGQMGAGAVWQDVMMLLYASPYNHNTYFIFDRLKEFTESGSVEYGLQGDDYTAVRDLLKNQSLILNPHDGDTIELQKDTIIPLKARETVDWFVDGAFFGHGNSLSFKPIAQGTKKIEAKTNEKSGFITIKLSTP